MIARSAYRSNVKLADVSVQDDLKEYIRQNTAAESNAD